MADALKARWSEYADHLARAEAARIRTYGDGGPPLGALIDEGPSEALSLTQNAQPALMLIEYGWDQVLRANGLAPAYVAGHSLGEYSAMLSAGVFDFDTALGLVMERGKLMSDEAAKVEGGMAAVLGLDRETLDWDKVKERAHGLLRVEIANINCPGQIVISGVKDDVARAAEILTELGARRVVPLTVSGAFHSTLMKPAADAFAVRLAETPFARAEVPVVQNSTTEPATEPEALLAGLVPQMAGPVLWQDSVAEMANRGVDTFVEAGPGTVLKGLVRRTAAEAKVLAVDDEKDREEIFALAGARA